METKLGAHAFLAVWGDVVFDDDAVVVIPCCCFIRISHHLSEAVCTGSTWPRSYPAHGEEVLTPGANEALSFTIRRRACLFIVGHVLPSCDPDL